MKNNLFIFDTNSLISALIIPSSVSRLSLKKADDNGVLIFSKETLYELNEVIIRSQFDKYVTIDDKLSILKDWK